MLELRIDSIVDGSHTREQERTMLLGKRRQLFVDRRVQGGIIVRCLLYWGTCLATAFVMLFFWSLLTGPARLSWMTVDQLWFQYGPAFVASILLLPLVVWDLLKVSNRFAGPVLRLRRELKKLARGEHVNPLFFRRQDHWRDMADDFNRVLARLKELEAKVARDERISMVELAQEHELVGTGQSGR
jgi:hypothetical protein